MKDKHIKALSEVWRSISLMYVDDEVTNAMQRALETHDLGGAMRALPTLDQAREKAHRMILVLAGKMRDVYQESMAEEYKTVAAMARRVRKAPTEERWGGNTRPRPSHSPSRATEWDPHKILAPRPERIVPTGHDLKPWQGRPDENPMSQVPQDEQWLLQEAAKLVVDVTDEQRDNLRQVLITRYDPTKRPDFIIRDIKKVTGLTDRETRAVFNREAALIDAGLSPAEVEKKTKQYAEDLHQLRGERIARTEGVFLETEARDNAWVQARADDTLPENTVKEWITDNTGCEECRAMDGQTTDIGGMFNSPIGPIKGPPYHPNCGCGIELSFAERRKYGN